MQSTCCNGCISIIQTWNGESIGLWLCQDPNSLPLFSGSKAFGVHGLRIQVVLHHVGDAHVSMCEAQLGKCFVQRSQHLVSSITAQCVLQIKCWLQ